MPLFVRSMRFLPDCVDIISAWKKYALKTVIWGARRGCQNIASACLPSLQAHDADAPIVGCIVVFVCCKMYAQHLARDEAARFYIFPLRVFVSSLFSFVLCVFHSLFFVPCLCVSFCFASFLVSYLVFSVPFLFLFVVFLVLSFFLCFAYYCYYLIIIIIKTLISFVCVRTHARTRTWSGGKTRHKKRAAKKPPLHVIKKST